MQAQKETVGFDVGGPPKKTGGNNPPVSDRLPTLAEAGIDKDLAKAARKLVAWSTELRKRAERRVGQIIAERKAAGKLAKPPVGPGRGKKGSLVKVGSAADPTFTRTLADEGVDKHLADRSRKAAAMPEEKFEADLARR